MCKPQRRPVERGALVQGTQHELTLRPAAALQTSTKCSAASQVGSTSALLSEIDAFTPGAARRKLMVSPRSMQNDHRIPLARRAPDNAVIIVFKNKIKRHTVQSIYGRERKTNTPPYSDKFKINSSLSFTCPLLEPYFFAFHFCLSNLRWGSI